MRAIPAGATVHLGHVSQLFSNSAQIAKLIVTVTVDTTVIKHTRLPPVSRAREVVATLTNPYDPDRVWSSEARGRCITGGKVVYSNRAVAAARSRGRLCEGAARRGA